MDCQELQSQIQDKTAECYDKRQVANDADAEADQCDAELMDLWMLWNFYCTGA